MSDEDENDHPLFRAIKEQADRIAQGNIEASRIANEGRQLMDEQQAWDEAAIGWLSYMSRVGGAVPMDDAITQCARFANGLMAQRHKAFGTEIEGLMNKAREEKP